jgi:glutamine cyclotransferase
LILIKRAVKSTVTAFASWGVPRVEPEIVRTFPHDRWAFTQGLAYVGDSLYESCGDQRHSTLRRIDPSNGSVKQSVSILNDFAEGIAVRGNRLYQLSWKSGKARVFCLPELTLVDELQYAGEGWGLCSGTNHLAMSNGTGRLRFLDEAFRVQRELKVTLNRLPIKRINDLEWVERSIYANVLFRSEILEIRVEDGCVTRIIDCSSLRKAVHPQDPDHTLNGIAYNRNNNTFFVTGKCWPVMFEVDFDLGGTRAVNAAKR